MGQEILYCFKCQERVTSSDLDSSNALRFGNRVSCKKCIPDLVITLTPEEQKELVARVQSPSSERRSSSVLTPRPRPSPAAAPGTRRAEKANSTAWVAIAAVGVAAVIGVAVFAMSGSGPADPGPRDAVVPPKPVPRNPEESPRERMAREAVAKAKAVPSSNIEGQIAAFAEAVKVTEGTSYYREAKEMHEGLLEMRRKAMVRELAAVDERAKVTLQKEEFGAAIAIYEAVRSLRADPDWKSLVDAKVGDVRKTVDLALSQIKEQAAQARGRGAEDEVKRLRERVSRWGLTDKTVDFDAHLQTIAPPPDVDARPWVRLFDGTLDFLTSKGEGSWVIENGALSKVKGKSPSGQSKRTFANGELRVRFEHRALQDMGVSVRQSAEGSYGVELTKIQLQALEGSEHELVIVFKGATVTAALDGKPLGVAKYGNSPSGHIQLNAHGERCLIKSVEVREAPEYDGLVGFWTFDEIQADKVADSSGCGNAGRLMDGAAVGAGRNGNALQLDGRRAYVEVPPSASLDLKGPFTIALWVKPNPSNKNRGLVEKWVPESTDIRDLTTGYFIRLNQTGNVQFIIPAAGDPDPEVRTQEAVAADGWTHLTSVFDGASMKVFLNGKPSRAVGSTLAPRSSKAPLRIGMGGGGGPHFFAGELDDVRIYNRALTADEILRLAK